MERMANERKKRTARDWHVVLVRLLWLLIVPVMMLLNYICQKNPSFTERYFTQGLFQFMRDVLSTVFSQVSFSVAEIIVYAVVLTVVLIILIEFIRMLVLRIRVAQFFRVLTGLLLTAAILFSVFYFSWGFNYSRPTLASLMGLDVHERSVDELESVCYSLQRQAVALRENLPENDKGVFALDASVQTCFSRIPSAYEALGKKYTIFSSKVYPAKPVIWSEAMSYAGISGIFFPFTCEANVNSVQPALLLISSAAHENAHSLGFAREDEANFVSYLACSYSTDKATQYSGLMLALVNLGNKLHDADSQKYAAFYASYSEKVQRDLKDHSAYWDSYEGPIEETVNKVNDNYLKFNQQDNGVKSYGMMVDLLLAYLAA